MRPGERARRVVNYPGDDGQELQDLAVSRHGDAIAYVRGGDPNDAGEIPNPNSLTVPPQRQVWLSDGGDPRLLGTGSSPQFSPDGGRVVWIDGQRVMSASRQGEPEQLFAFEGGLSMLRFSPDGGRVAYQRSSRIEIRDLATGATTVVANPGGASDSRPSWSPDGTRVAFIRTASGQPFSIWLADTTTGEARQVWQADTGVGSAFYALDQEDQLLWSGDERIAFPWEGDGYRHLYAVPAAGGAAALLTPGEGEVEVARVSRDRARLIYATNIGDIGRRHLAAVDFGGGEPEALTSGRESQWAPTPLADGGVAYIDAGWADPPAVVVRDASGATTEAGRPRVPSSFPADEMVEPKLIEFPATDGETAYGQLFVPRPERAKGCGVIFPHGGPRRQMLPGFHYIEVYTNLYELNQYLASQGCVVLSVDYRSGIMHGHAFRNAPEIGRAGASEYRDVLAGALYLQSRPDVDSERIGIHGLSWGGYLVGLALARNSDVFKVGFDQAGVHEFFEDAFPFSPMADIDKWTSPVYLAQGDDDRNVDFDQGVRLARALQSRRPEVELVQRVFPDETHDMYLTFDHLTDLYGEGSRFLLDRLEPAG
jgi:dipeptidyl aminopeptidase/acylaminoacyl peptidase